jgi:hypothetical protein
MIWVMRIGLARMSSRSAIFADDLVGLEVGQALQLHLEDALRLDLGQVVAVGVQAELGADVDRARIFGIDAGQHLLDHRRLPRAAEQALPGDGRRFRRLDQLDDLVDVGERDRQSLEDVAALARLPEVEHGAAGDDFAAVAQKGVEHLLEIQQARLAVDQRNHVHAEGVLHLRLLVQIVQDHVGVLAALQLDVDAHARLVGLVAQIGDALDLLVAHQLADLDQQVGLVHLVRQLVDDDRLLAAALVEVLDVAGGAHHHAAAARAVAVAHAREAVDDAGSRKVGRLDDGDQRLDVDLGIVEQRMQRGADVGEVVRRDVGRHAHGDAGRTVDQQVGDLGRQHQRLLLGAVVVGAEVDRFLVEVGQQLVRDLRHAHFGVTHRRRVVAVDRAEVALAVDQRIAQREVLRHAHHGVVHRGVAVRVVFTDDVADHAGRFLVSLVPVVAKFVHRVEDATMHGLEAVAHVRQRASDDHAHGVIEIGTTHLLFEADREGFLGKLFHVRLLIVQA